MTNLTSTIIVFWAIPVLTFVGLLLWTVLHSMVIAYGKKCSSRKQTPHPITSNLGTASYIATRSKTVVCNGHSFTHISRQHKQFGNG